MESTLGSMIIRLVGETKSFEDSVDKSEKMLIGFGEKAKSIGGNLTKFLSLPLAAIGVAGIKAFGDSEEAMGRFEAALRATGTEAKVNTGNIATFAKELQNLTGIEDDTIIGGAGLLQSLTALDEKGLKQIIPRVLNFSKAMKVDLETAFQLVGKTISTDTNALGRYGIEIDNTLSPTEKLAKITEALDGKFKDFAASVSDKGLGPLNKLKLMLGDLSEDIGQQLLPVINDLIPPIKETLKAFSSLDNETKKMIVTAGLAAAAIGPVVGVLGNLVTTAPKVVGAVSTMLGALGPSAPIVLGVTALVAAVIAANAALDDFAKKQKQFEMEQAKAVENWKKEKALGRTIQNELDEIEAQIKLKRQEVYTLQANIENTRSEDIKRSNQKYIDQLNNEIKALEQRLKLLKSEANKPTQQKQETKKQAEDNLSSGLEEFKLKDSLLKQDLLQIEYEKLQKKEAEDQLDLINAKIRAKEEEKKKEEELQETILKTGQYTQQGLDFLANLSSTLSNNRMIEINDEYNRQKENIEKTITDEKAKREALSALDEQYAEKTRTEKRKAAEAEKTWSIVQSIISTAVAVTKALPSVPLSIAAGVAGAAQTALIAAQAIPQFKNGGYITSPTVGLLAEAGNPEFAIPDRPNVTDILATRILNGMGKMTGTNVINNMTPTFVVHNEFKNGELVTWINQQSAKGNIQISPTRGIARR